MKNYNSAWVKRLAKQLKKTKQIPHHEALDQAAQAVGFQNWGHFLNSKAPVSRTIQRGLLVRFKARSWQAILVAQSDESVTCYTDWGTLNCLRREISICRDQTNAASFKPMRIVLPYGKWTCADGTEVLFNRDYRPIWKRQPSGMVVAADPDEWVQFSQEEHFFGDHNTPDENRNSYRICINQLRSWGVENGIPVMLNLFRKAVDEGDLTLMDKQSP